MNTKNLTATSQYNLHLGDNLATLKNYPDNTFDSIITDPPYGIDFLGKEWDSHTGTVELYKECLRVLKPGGYLLAFSAARTYHKLAYSVELAGFEIRDQLMWLYSSGFPKAQDIGKAIQKRLGVKEYEQIDMSIESNRTMGFSVAGKSGQLDAGLSGKKTICTDELPKQWEGYKTALKPAHEPIVMARKPYKGSTIDQVLKNGLGAMNIDATRVEYASDKDVENRLSVLKNDHSTCGLDNIFRGVEGIAKLKNEVEFTEEFVEQLSLGRYPSNVIGEVAEGYQKYFYCPKVSRKERHSGFAEDSLGANIDANTHGKTPYCNHCNKTFNGSNDHSKCDPAMKCFKESRNQNAPAGNNHPTVKPVALMEYLIKLVTPPSTPTLQRKVLDPFMGSGSTGMAAVKLGHHFTGCELDPKYVAIAATRIDAWNTVEVDDNPLDPELFGDD